ncbi:MAG: hypothetical protein HYX90_01730 [Chloroflexi bacterium]|nr:hypothetical protein [Chloroflexota bacterium]
MPATTPTGPPAAFTRAGNGPLLVGTRGAWDDNSLESPAVIRDGNTYYMYYHAVGKEGPGYRVGLARAASPGGPWTKYGSKPVLTVGPRGSWEDGGVAIGHVAREGGRFYMWYMGSMSAVWNVGLATAPAPEGPWTKYRGNPVLSVGRPGEWDSVTLYVASVARLGGTYYLWYVGFRDHTDQDGQLGLATAPAPEGPWTKYQGNPVMMPGPAGSWNAGQINEAAIAYREGLFHAWYAGYPERNILRAEIGYAYSLDGIRWVDGPGNPVVRRGRKGDWDGDRLSEPHVLLEGDRIYLFHTGARYHDGKPVEALGLSIGAWSGNVR